MNQEVIMKGAALDTNTAIDLLNGVPDTFASLKAYDLICLPATVVGELLFGAANSQNHAVNLPRFQEFISTCIFLRIDEAVAQVYSQIRLQLKKQGTPIPENDIWIAATCQAHGIRLLTRDKHFAHIPTLEFGDK